MRFVTLPSIYLAGFLVSMLKSSFDYHFRDAHVRWTTRHGREIDVSYFVYFATALFWPVMLLFYAFLIVVGFKRFRKVHDDWIERKTGTRPRWTIPDEKNDE